MKAIQQEIDFLGNSEFELIAGEYRTQPVPSRRKRLENAYIKNQKQFIADLKTVVSDLTKNRDFPNAERVQNFIDSDPLCTSSPGPWLYLFDGTEESFRKNWVLHPEFKVENGMLIGPYSRFAIIKEVFDDFELEACFCYTERATSLVCKCYDLRCDIGHLINLLDGILRVRVNNITESREFRDAQITKNSFFKMGIVSQGNVVKFYFNDCLIYQMGNNKYNYGAISVEGGSFKYIKIRAFN